MPLKRFLMASALALSFVVSAPTVAKADPITAAIVTWAGFTAGTTAFAVATFVVNSALYAAGSWAVTKAAKALGLMKSNVAERQASVTTLSLGETPREAVVGIACVGGSLIDAWNHGGKYGTDYVTRRVALADHVLDGLIGYYVDDTYYSFNGNGVQPGFNGALQLTFVNATRDGAFPPPYMLQAGVGLTSADRCPSVAEIWITYKFDDQVWTRGHPGLKFVVRGLRAYDPRFDPQYGYTGPSPQTWDDVSTHRFSENAAIVRYNIQRGVYAVGRHGELEHLLIGRGLTADEAPAARIIAAANVCDEIVDGLPRYTVGGAISSAQAHIEVEEMFAAATAGQIVQRDGGVEVEPGQAKAAVVTVTDADLVAGEAISFDEFTPDTDGGRVNTVIARYVEPSQLYKDHSGAVLRDQADIVEDGGPRELTLPLMLVTNKGQADRCAEITRRGARLERRARIALVPMLLAGRASAELEDGDIIAWQSNRYHEGATVRYRIEAYGVDEGWRNTLQLREMASSVFGQADPVEDRAALPPTPIPVDALQLIGVQAEAIILPGDTSTVPAIRFKWDVTTADTAMTAIRAEVRRLGETDVAPTRTEEIDAGVMVVTNGVGPDQDMQARLVPLGDPTKPVVPSPWITVSTSTIIAGDLSPESPVRIAVTEITDRLVSVERISATNAAAVADLEEVFGDTVSAAASAAAAAEEAAVATQAKADALVSSATASQQAAAATQQALNAQTQAGNAQIWADQSAGSASIASGAAATSTEQAGLSATARDEAEGFAGAAFNYQNQASGFVTDAEAAAAVSTAQKLQAIAARDEAVAKAAASAISAANASASETEAGVQAAASQSARNAADAARGQAETYRNETATARDTAQGAAATATAQAGLSASSAGASQAAANNPLATSPALTPDAFLVNSWEALNGSPNLRQVYADNPGVIYPVGSTVEVNTYGAGFHINTAKALPRPEGHRFRYSATVQRKVDAGTAEQNKVTLFAWFWDANGGSLGGWEFYSVNPGTSSGAVTLTAEHAPPAGTAWTRTLVRIFSTVGVTAIVSLDTQDIESEKTATAAATASVAGASVASTKADEAGASAAAANAAKVAAEIARDGASGSASASATSASQALAYRNQAGEFATSSSGSANQAATAAGQSLAYRDQSAASSAEAVSAAARAGTSASNAGQSEYNAYQNYVGAAAAAATAVEQASTAGAHAASASISANLAASVSAPRGQLLYNSTGNQGMDGWAGGPNWYAQDIGYGFGRGFRCGVSGSYFYNDSAHFAGIAPESWVTWSADPQVFGGTCDLWLEFYDGGFNRIGGIYAQRQVSNRDFGDPISSEVLAPAGAFNARLVVLPTFSSGGSAGVRRMKVERGRLPATAWSDEETTKALAAQLNITAAVAADVATRMTSVQFSVTGGAGGDPFDISLKAGPSGSDASITATKVRLRNIVNGEAVEALRIENGKSKFFGDVEVNGGSMNFNNRFIVAQDGTTTIRSGQTGERMWIEGKTIKGWYANGQQAYQLG